jgi:hypothetical protein
MVWNPIHDDLFSSINQLITNNISEMFCYFALKNEGIYEDKLGLFSSFKFCGHIAGIFLIYQINQSIIKEKPFSFISAIA